MRKIIYLYSSLTRQILIITLGLLFFARLILFIEGSIFNLKEFQIFNLPASIGLMIILIALCIFLFFGQKFFYAEFTEHKLVFHNLITRKSKTFDLNKVVFAKFTGTGIKLYYNKDKKPVFKIPFYRFGIVSPIGIESFEKLMKYKNVDITKTYTVLPCYSRGFKFINIAYIALIVGLGINAFQIIVLDILIFKQCI